MIDAVNAILLGGALGGISYATLYFSKKVRKDAKKWRDKVKEEKEAERKAWLEETHRLEFNVVLMDDSVVEAQKDFKNAFIPLRVGGFIEKTWQEYLEEFKMYVLRDVAKEGIMVSAKWYAPHTIRRIEFGKTEKVN